MLLGKRAGTERGNSESVCWAEQCHSFESRSKNGVKGGLETEFKRRELSN